MSQTMSQPSASAPSPPASPPPFIRSISPISPHPFPKTIETWGGQVDVPSIPLTPPPSPTDFYIQPEIEPINIFAFALYADKLFDRAEQDHKTPPWYGMGPISTNHYSNPLWSPCRDFLCSLPPHVSPHIDPRPLNLFNDCTTLRYILSLPPTTITGWGGQSGWGELTSESPIPIASGPAQPLSPSSESDDPDQDLNLTWDMCRASRHPHTLHAPDWVPRHPYHSPSPSRSTPPTASLLFNGSTYEEVETEEGLGTSEATEEVGEGDTNAREEESVVKDPKECVEDGDSDNSADVIPAAGPSRPLKRKRKIILSGYVSPYRSPSEESLDYDEEYWAAFSATPPQEILDDYLHMRDMLHPPQPGEEPRFFFS
ncbi:hypothetical protein CVT24_013119 [Panaeolus cyanescens]|uniref:Uncharacterized protein n=1 Tax=Panaeolus cyanescens TaxID=181874 RepID=A0A409YN59_9AGAR|nr:hypothetical protein CVT24_013119 [Panaeolus cyanescens]